MFNFFNPLIRNKLKLIFHAWPEASISPLESFQVLCCSQIGRWIAFCCRLGRRTHSNWLFRLRYIRLLVVRRSTRPLCHSVVVIIRVRVRRRSSSWWFWSLLGLIALVSLILVVPASRLVWVVGLSAIGFVITIRAIVHVVAEPSQVKILKTIRTNNLPSFFQCDTNVGSKTGEFVWWAWTMLRWLNQPTTPFFVVVLFTISNAIALPRVRDASNAWLPWISATQVLIVFTTLLIWAEKIQ